MSVVLAQVRFPDISSLPRDVMQNDFVFEDSTLAAALVVAKAAVPDFYNGTSGGAAALSTFLSQVISRAVVTTINYYDITTTLDGSPHGSPVDQSTFTPTAPTSAVDIPSECAVCFSYHGDLTGLVEEGATPVATPSSEEAIDEGAPTTHMALPRPRARHRGRLYIGPLSFGAVQTSGGAQCLVQPNLISSLHQCGVRLLALTGANWRVWSRRNAAVYTVTGGFIDNAFDTLRKRGVAPSSRNIF